MTELGGGSGLWTPPSGVSPSGSSGGGSAGVPPMTIHAPPGAGVYPALVGYHGGAPGTGGRHDLDGLADTLVTYGIILASIDYRVDAFPHAIDDGVAAVAYLKANAGALHINPAKVGVFGSSFGAIPACGVGTFRPGVAWAMCGWSGVYNLVTFLADPNPPAADKTAVQTYMAPGTAAAASDQGQVTAGSAPAFLATSTAEVIPRYEADDFAAALVAAGRTVTELVITGSYHGAQLAPYATGPMVTFLQGLP